MLYLTSHNPVSSFDFISTMDFGDLVTKKCIDLMGFNLHDSEIDVLNEVIKKSKVLEVLLLCNNNLTLANGRFTDALAKNCTLRTLNLHSNQISNEGAKQLATESRLTNLSRVSI